MKIAVDFQSGPDMTALTRPVTYDWPALTRARGCSLTASDGTTQLTDGRWPVCAAVRKWCTDTMFCSWSSWWTVVKYGSGFQMPGVLALCGTRGQVMSASFSQSGSSPRAT